MVDDWMTYGGVESWCLLHGGLARAGREQWFGFIDASYCI